MEKELDEFKTLFGKLMAGIDGDIEITETELLALIAKTGLLGDILMKNIQQLPCAERKTIVTSHEFLVGLAKHIVSECRTHEDSGSA